MGLSPVLRLICCRSLPPKPSGPRFLTYKLEAAPHSSSLRRAICPNPTTAHKRDVLYKLRSAISLRAHACYHRQAPSLQQARDERRLRAGRAKEPINRGWGWDRAPTNTTAVAAGRGHLLPSCLSQSPEGIHWVHLSQPDRDPSALVLHHLVPSPAGVHPTSSAAAPPQLMNAPAPSL